MVTVHPYAAIRELSSRDTTNPEGAGFDLRVSSMWQLTRTVKDHLWQYLGNSSYVDIDVGATLGVDERSTVDTIPYQTGCSTWDDGYYYLAPGQYYLISTIEEMQIPVNALGLIWPRTTLLRSGVTLETGVVNPGYEGSLTMGIMNHGLTWFRLEPGARFCHILFFPVDDGAIAYRGQWQGGRVSQPNSEVQV